jgi:hypothetical protein
MTAKEKAKELYEKIYFVKVNYSGCWMFKDAAKQCALICVNELLNTVPYINNTQSEVKKRIYYMDVRAEINKI